MISDHIVRMPGDDIRGPVIVGNDLPAEARVAGEGAGCSVAPVHRHRKPIQPAPLRPQRRDLAHLALEQLAGRRGEGECRHEEERRR